MQVLLIITGTLLFIVTIFFVASSFFRVRMQHYNFAHRLLPQEMFNGPADVLVPMLSAKGFSEEGREHLLGFWEAAGERIPPKNLVPADSLTYSMEVLGHPNSTAYLITLPPPLKKMEAYFALLVFDGPGLVCDKFRHLRYFVLEHRGLKNGVASASIGEWKPKPDGSLEYTDHGCGLPPDKQAFMSKVQQIIQTSGSQP